jgi:hypothetical protein
VTGQPPTPDEIRSLYVETLARAAYERTLKTRPPSSPRWDDGDLGMEDVRDHYREGIAYLADALAAAGLLPDVVDSRYIGRGMQRRWRLATDWKEPGE